jgi:ornithine carbamoyltransferase
MAATREGSALYMHCLPADITGVSCAQGEVAASVFDRYRVPVYREASYKPYIIAGMILLSRVKNLTENLGTLLETATPRVR